MRYLSIVTVLPAVIGVQPVPGLEKQRVVLAWKLSNVLLWTGSAAKCILAT